MNLESDYVSWDEYRALKAALEAKDAEIERAWQAAGDASKQTVEYLDRARAAEAALKEAREGLRPFADLDGEGNDDFPDDAKVTATFGHITDYTLKLGDIRKARALLSKQDSGERP
jgi:hypothetical protein